MSLVEAVTHELEDRGFTVSQDTFSSGQRLYIAGEGDLAKALFEIAPTALDAFEQLYSQGHWVQGMPLRFAVLPLEERGAPEFEMLEQIEVVPLLYRNDGQKTKFVDLSVLDDLCKEES